jgi:hypothetical protein
VSDSIPDRAAASPRALYFRAALDLGEAVRLNRQDTLFADTGREIVYVLDTNAAVHYLQNVRYSTGGEFSFGGLIRDPKAALVNDRLTIEYLLSGGLPGQRDLTVYMCPAHWNETLDYAASVVRDIGRLRDKAPPEQIEQLRAPMDPQERIHLAERLLPDWIINALKAAPAVRRRLREALMEEPVKLRPLDRHEDYWTKVMDRVRTEDLRAWRAAVFKARTDQHQPRRTRDNSRNFENDILSLTILQALYRENPEACGEGRDLMFLFVTADRGILKAVEARRDALEAEGIPMFARHPRVFSPLLNFSNMSRTWLRENMKFEVDSKLKSVFQEVEKTLDRFIELDPSHAGSERRGQLWDTANRELGKSMRRWSNAARQLAASQAHFFARDSEEIKEAAELLSSPDALLATSELLGETIRAIRDRYVQYQAPEALRQLANIGQRQAAGRLIGRRAPLGLFGVDLLEPLRQVIPPEVARNANRGSARGLYSLLDYIATHSIDQALLTRIGQKLLDHWQQSSSQLLASCMYLAVGAWDSARDCARRGREGAKVPSLLRREANYCFALASRFVLRTAEDLKEADQALQENRDDYGHDRSSGGPIASLRDKIERAALLSTASILQAIDDVTPFVEEFGQGARILEGPGIVQYFDRAARLENEAWDTLEHDYSGPPDSSDSGVIFQRLRLQLFTNIVGTHVFRHSLRERVSEQPYCQDDLARALERLEEECEGRDPPQVARVYRNVAAAILLQTPQTVAVALGVIDVVLVDPGLSYGDKMEYRHLSGHLRQIEISLAMIA